MSFILTRQLYRIERKLDFVLRQLGREREEDAEMAAVLADVQAAVAANTTQIGSVVELIRGFADLLQEAIDRGASPAELQALVDELRASDQALAEAAATIPTAPPTPPA